MREPRSRWQVVRRSLTGGRTSKGFGVGRHGTKNYKVRYREVEPKGRDYGDKLCNVDVGVLRESNEGGSRNNRPKNTRSGEAQKMIPAERAARFSAEGDLHVHGIGSRHRDRPGHDVRHDKRKVKKLVCNRKCGDVDSNIDDADRGKAEQLRSDRSTAPSSGNFV